MLCGYGEILLNVAVSGEQTITNRFTGEIITLIDNQGDRSKPDPVEKERKTVCGGIYSGYTWLMLYVFGEILLNVAASCEQPITHRVTGEIITLIDIQGDQRKTGPG